MTKRSRTYERRSNRAGRAPVLPNVSLTGGMLSIDRNKVNWTEIEGDYLNLSEQQRSTLLDALDHYLHFAQFERAALPLSDSKKIIAKIAKAADALMRAASSQQYPGKDDAFDYAMECIGTELNPEEGATVDASLAHAVAKILVSCNLALQKLEGAPIESGFKWGDSWKSLLWDLLNWANAEGLIVGLAKKTDNSKNWPSPFVKFALRLTSLLPSTYRDSDTDSAMTTKLLEVRTEGAKRFSQLTPAKKKN